MKYRYTVDQRVFIYATYIKTGSISHTRKIYKEQYNAKILPQKSTILKIAKRFRETGSFKVNSESKMGPILTDEKLEEIHSKLIETPDMPLDVLSWETGMTNAALKDALKILQIDYKEKKRLEKKKKKKSRKKPVKIVIDDVITIDSDSDNDDCELILPDIEKRPKRNCDDAETDDPLSSSKNSVILNTNIIKTEVSEDVPSDCVILESHINALHTNKTEVMEVIPSDCVVLKSHINVKEETVMGDTNKEILTDSVEEEIFDEDDESHELCIDDVTVKLEVFEDQGIYTIVKEELDIDESVQDIVIQNCSSIDSFEDMRPESPSIGISKAFEKSSDSES